jgi:hypothetical protein
MSELQLPVEWIQHCRRLANAYLQNRQPRLKRDEVEEVGVMDL